MSSRNRKDLWVRVEDMWVRMVDIQQVIEKLDYQHYDEHLRRVRSHPKNLLRLSNRRLSEARESQRDINNGERYKSAVKRSLFRRSIVDWRTISDEN